VPERSNDVVLDQVIELTRSIAGPAAKAPIGADTVLVGKGAEIDSIALLEVLEAVATEFGVNVMPADIALTNFSSVRSLAMMVTRSIV
jgi:acyl carrier protein